MIIDVIADQTGSGGTGDTGSSLLAPVYLWDIARGQELRHFPAHQGWGRSLSFSPDGAWIGFVANGELRKVPSAGGPSVKLLEGVDPTYNNAAWLSERGLVPA